MGGGKEKQRTRPNECGCQEINEAEFRVSEEEESRAKNLCQRLAEDIVEQQVHYNGKLTARNWMPKPVSDDFYEQRCIVWSVWGKS